MQIFTIFTKNFSSKVLKVFADKDMNEKHVDLP